MPKVDMIATRDFKYNTRRLMAGDTFEARGALDAHILERVRKVAAPHAPEAIEPEAVEELPEVADDEPDEAPKPRRRKKAAE